MTFQCLPPVSRIPILCFVASIFWTILANSKVPDRDECGQFLSSGPEDADIEISLGNLTAFTGHDTFFLYWWAPKKSGFEYNLSDPLSAELYDDDRAAFAQTMTGAHNGGGAQVGPDGMVNIRLNWPARYWADQQRRDEPRPTINLMWCNTKKLSWKEKLILKEDRIYPESCDFDHSPVMVYTVTKPPGITIWTNSGSRCPDSIAINDESERSQVTELAICILFVGGMFFWGVMVLKEQGSFLNKASYMTPMEMRILKQQKAKQN